MVKLMIFLTAMSCSSMAYSAENIYAIAAVQQAKIQDHAKTLQALQNELVEIKKKLSAVEVNFLSKFDAERNYAKPGQSVGISLSNCTEDYNFVDLRTEHQLVSYQCNSGKVSIGVRHYGIANRVDRVYCCSLSGSIQ